MSSEIAIKVENLSKCYQIYDQPHNRLKQFFFPRLQRAVGQQSKQYFREFWALKDVSFEVKKGETVGIIGRNGSGKSTLLQMICGTLNPTNGTIQTQGRIAALLELGSGFNPEFTGRENVYMNAAMLGVGRDEIDKQFDEITAFADIGEFLEQPVKTYSSGMQIRLAFAVSTCVKPDILIIDEALSVGDMGFQQKCFHRIEELQKRGTTLLFVSHDLHLIRQFCNESIYIENGKVKYFGASEIASEKYLFDIYSDQFQFDNQLSRWEDDGSSVGKLSFGSRRGNIKLARFIGKDSSVCVIERGQQITLEVHADAAGDVRSPELVFQLRDNKGTVIYGLSSEIDDLQVVRSDDIVSVKSFFKLPIHLAPGNYAITIGFNDRQSNLIYSILDKAVGVAEFSVARQGNEKFHGCVNMYGAWGIISK